MPTAEIKNQIDPKIQNAKEIAMKINRKPIEKKTSARTTILTKPKAFLFRNSLILASAIC